MITSSDDEAEIYDIPLLDIDSPAYFQDFSHLTPYTRLLNRNESRFNFESCTLIGRSQREKYGKLLVSTFKKLVKNKFLSLSNLNDTVYRKIIDVFLKTVKPPTEIVKTKYSKPTASSQHIRIKKLLSCFPTTSSISKRLKSSDINNEVNRNELLFIRITLNLKQKFYLEHDFPLYKNYLKKHLSLLCRFYERISQENLDYILDRMNNASLIKYKNVLYKTPEEYIDHFRREEKELLCLAGGLEINQFIN